MSTRLIALMFFAIACIGCGAAAGTGAWANVLHMVPPIIGSGWWLVR